MAEERPNSAEKSLVCILNSWMASGEGRRPTLPKRAFRDSMPSTRKLSFDSRRPATLVVTFDWPTQAVAGEFPVPTGATPGESTASCMKFLPFNGSS